MGSGGVIKFDFSTDSGPTSYFKSSFARSMAHHQQQQSKSLDYALLDEESIISEEDVSSSSTTRTTITAVNSSLVPPASGRILTTTHHGHIVVSNEPRRSVPTLPTFDPSNFSRGSELRLSRSGSARPPQQQHQDPLKFWKMKQDSQSVMESNRTPPVPSVVDGNLLQSQINTLQWQLKQAESNRQMYRAVMEQVSKFLERVHKAMECNSSKTLSPKGKQRVPRSRSVHTVVTQSRASSPSPSHPGNVHRANSISQIQDSYATFRDHAWRSSRAIPAEDVTPERLSQDAFRLMRTVQSLLNTREPDLARVSDSCQRRDSASMGSCSSLVQSSCCSSTREVEDNKSGGGGPSTPQLSVGSTEDESGFSSMSSFHGEALLTNNHATSAVAVSCSSSSSPSSSPSSSGLGATAGGGGGSGDNASGSHHELGLPLVVDNQRHRRWSSTPVDTGFRPPLRVLWV